MTECCKDCKYWMKTVTEFSDCESISNIFTNSIKVSVGDNDDILIDPCIKTHKDFGCIDFEMKDEVLIKHLILIIEDGLLEINKIASSETGNVFDEIEQRVMIAADGLDKLEELLKNRGDIP